MGVKCEFAKKRQNEFGKETHTQKIFLVGYILFIPYHPPLYSLHPSPQSVERSKFVYYSGLFYFRYSLVGEIFNQ